MTRGKKGALGTHPGLDEMEGGPREQERDSGTLWIPSFFWSDKRKMGSPRERGTLLDTDIKEELKAD